MRRLKDLREDHDLKQSDIAAILGISQQYYQCYESGKNELPLRHCITLAEYYNVSIDYLVGIIDIPVPTKDAPSKALTKYSELIRKFESADEKVKQAILLLLS